MKGLIIKDLLFIKSTWKNLLIMLAGSVMISVALGNYLLAVCVLPVMLLSSGINTFQTDEFYNTESYLLSYPYSRKQIVLSKYLFTLIMLIIATYIGLMTYAIIHFTINPGYNGLNVLMLKQLMMWELAAIFVNSVFYPVIYKFGCEKSRFVMMSILMVLLGVIALTSAYINTQHLELDFQGIIDFVQTYGIYLLSGIVTLSFVLSYIISIIVYKRKDY